MANQPVIFGLVGGGALLLTAAVTNSGLGATLQGHAHKVSDKSALDTVVSGVKSGNGAVGSVGAAAVTPIVGLVSKVKGKPVPTLPYGTALTGVAATSWAVAILATMRAPATPANIRSLVDWFGREGGGGANNPLNTTLQTSGSTGSINSVGVQSYSNPKAGIAATVQTLEGGYPGIVAALQQGVGLSNAGPGVAAELSKWSGGGYNSL